MLNARQRLWYERGVWLGRCLRRLAAHYHRQRSPDSGAPRTRSADRLAVMTLDAAGRRYPGNESQTDWRGTG